MKTKNLENFQKLVSNEDSGWLNKFLHYKANQKRFDNSSKVAVNVLEALREKKMSQKDLAKKMEVSAQQINKIVKGQQNLTFGTIGKLEEALGITLIEIPKFKTINEIQTNSTTQIRAFEKTNIEIIKPTNPFSSDFIKQDGQQMSIVYNKYTNINYKKAV